jgi:hypothetical protein
MTGMAIRPPQWEADDWRSAAVAHIVALPSRPLPAAGFVVHELRSSQGFADDPTALIMACDRFEADCRHLVGALTAHWGEPVHVDLWPYKDLPSGRSVPPMIDLLSAYAPGLAVWRVADRSIAVGLGQWDLESPIALIAAVGEVDLTAA